MNHYVGDKARRNACTHSDSGKNDAISDASLLSRNPSRYELIRGGKHDRFARAEKKAHRRKTKKRNSDFGGDDSRKGSEKSPPQYSYREHAPRSHAIRKPTSKRLEKRVPNEESTSKRSPLNFGQVKLCSEGTSGDGDVDAIDVRNSTQYKEPEDEKPAHATLRAISHAKFLDSKG